MPYVDIGTYAGLISDDKKKEIALKVRSLLAKELGKDEGAFIITATGIPKEQWPENIEKMRQSKQVVIDFEPKK